VILLSYPLPSTDPLGTDIKLDANGDLVVDQSGSLYIVTNENNVAQGVRVNITTLPYSYLWDDDVGTYLASYVDQPITDQMEKEITNIIIERLSEDDRIIEVQGITIDDSQADRLLITISAVVDSIGEVQIPVIVGGA
jgi:hypothetical protein